MQRLWKRQYIVLRTQPQHQAGKRSFRARPPSKTKSWRCENEAFVISLKKWKWKIWKRSFRARLPSKSPTLTCEHQAWTGSPSARPIRAWSAPSRTCSATFVRQTFPIHLPRHISSCKTQHSVHPLSLKNAFYARLPSKSASWRCESEAFVRDFPQ